MIKRDLRLDCNLSSASMAKLTKGQNVNTDVLVRICEVPNCDISDICEIVRVKKQEEGNESVGRYINGREQKTIFDQKESIILDLTELRDRVSALPTLENRLAHLQKEIRNAEDEVSGLLRQYEQERRDVEQIQQESFSAFLYKLVGKYEDKPEKEQREEIDAKLAYDRAKTSLDGLVRDKDDLAARITALRADERTYQVELAKSGGSLRASLPSRRVRGMRSLKPSVTLSFRR